MEILSINAERKLIEIASSIAHDPKTWHGWFCLKINLSACDGTLYEDSLGLTRSIINTHLKDLQGHTFICENKTIHILCKPPSENILEQTGVQICDLINSENGSQVKYTLYNLRDKGNDYTEDVTGTTGSIFKLPKAKKSEKENIEEGTIPMKQPDAIGKKQLSSKGDTPKVLLVEDDPITRWMVRNSLKEICDFATAPTANKAYAMYKSYEPDLVFLDINLPDNNGRAVLNWIIEHDPGACVVMFSSNDSLENITECLNNGASGFVTKPFLKEDLLHYVRHHTG
jgi:two-component system chemotaxis response regulator CheY